MEYYKENDIYHGESRPSLKKLTLAAIIVLIVGLCLTPSVARSQEAPQRIRALFCDTAEQVKEVLLATDVQEVVESINARDGENSCGRIDALADSTEDAEQVIKGDKTYAIVKVHIVGMILGPGMVLPAEIIQYAARRLEGLGT